MNALAKYRGDTGMTQEQIAAILGTTNATVSRWESEKRQPNPTMALVIESKLGIPLHELRPDLYRHEVGRKTKSNPTVDKKKTALFGFMADLVTLSADFNPEEPFWELHKDFDGRDVESGPVE